jgi:hypothetical protein
MNILKRLINVFAVGAEIVLVAFAIFIGKENGLLAFLYVAIFGVIGIGLLACIVNYIFFNKFVVINEVSNEI